MRPQHKACLKCRICKTEYETRINKLTMEVDVYCEWIDECERLNNEARLGLGPAKKSKLGYNEEDKPEEETKKKLPAK